MICRLCGNTALSLIAPPGDARTYYRCHHCSLIFADPVFHLSEKNEKLRYNNHNNSIHHGGYVDFLNRIIQPCLPYLSTKMIGLDYGCGPEPTLSKILARQNIRCFDYDPIFGFQHPDSTYDFIFATECVEHFHYPEKDFDKIDILLKPGGYLAVMTERWKNLEVFNTWYYKRDPTHVSFFHEETFNYLCRRYRYQIKYADESRVMIFLKS